MEVSLKATNTVALQVFTNDEWEDIDFFIIDLSHSYIDELEKRLMCLQPLRELGDFANVQFWDSFDGYNSDEDFQFKDGDEWAYVVGFDEDLCTSPESRLDTHLCRINNDGEIQWKCYGKDTGMEFWTTTIPLRPFIDDFRRDNPKSNE